jgi:hypothetical protein
MSIATKILIINILFFSIQVLGQTKLARINDPDGYTNVRSGKGTDFEIVAQFKDGEYFHCEPSTDDWWLVQIFSDQYGYIHRSRITLISSLSDKEKYQLIDSTLIKLKLMRLAYDSISKSDSKTLQLSKLEELGKYEETRYTPLLDYLSEQFCSHKDSNLLNRFLDVMVINQLSANEMPSWTLGDCYICYPDLVISKIQSFSKEDREVLFNDLLFGFENVTWQKESQIKDYKVLNDKLNKYIKKARL